MWSDSSILKLFISLSFIMVKYWIKFYISQTEKGLNVLWPRHMMEGNENILIHDILIKSLKRLLFTDYQVIYPSGSPERIMRETETGHCSGDTVNLEIPDKYLSLKPLSTERFLLHLNQIHSFGLCSFWSPKFGDAARNPKGRVGSQMDGGQSQIPTYPHFLVFFRTPDW